MKSRFQKLFNDKKGNFYLALLLTIFFCLFETTFSENNLYSYFQYLRHSEDYVYLFIGILYTLVSYYCLFTFLKISLASDQKYKIIYFALFCLTVFLEYSYQKALGRFSDMTDFQTVTTATTEQTASAIFLYFNIAAIVPCLIYLICLIKSKPLSAPLKLKGLLIVVLMYGIFFTHVSFISEIFAERKFPVTALNASVRTISDYLVWQPIFTASYKVRKTIEKPDLPENYFPQNNIIIIQDESIAGTHLSINGYARKTTPFLETLEAKGILHNWGIAAAATTASQSTYDILITGLTPDEFPDKSEKKIRTSPTFLQYAKAMNYKTYVFDGQMRYYWGVSQDDLNYIDSRSDFTNITPERAIEPWEIDNEIAKRVNKIVSTSTGNFIFILKEGNHMPYNKNYPKIADGYKELLKTKSEIYNSKYPRQSEIWTPTYNFNSVFEIPSAEHHDEVVNSYDNALAFNLDSFFKFLIDDYTQIPNNTVIFYTGDHGQTFFANGRASHAGSTKEEATVPLFMIGNPPMSVDTNYKASHNNLLPTMLDLMNYPENLRKGNYALSLFKATTSDSKPRFFNPLFGPKVPFD